jgi:hypothetical protein
VSRRSADRLRQRHLDPGPPLGHTHGDGVGVAAHRVLAEATETRKAQSVRETYGRMKSFDPIKEIRTKDERNIIKEALYRLNPVTLDTHIPWRWNKVKE